MPRSGPKRRWSFHYLTRFHKVLRWSSKASNNWFPLPATCNPDIQSDSSGSRCSSSKWCVNQLFRKKRTRVSLRMFARATYPNPACRCRSQHMISRHNGRKALHLDWRRLRKSHGLQISHQPGWHTTSVFFCYFWTLSGCPNEVKRIAQVPVIRVWVSAFWAPTIMSFLSQKSQFTY